MNKVIIACFMFLCFGFTSNPTIHVFMIGDSTMANKSKKAEPECGWGQQLHEYFTSDVEIHNHAQNGRSSKSFINENRWKGVLDSLKAGDYVIIQFGHNDSKADSTRHTDPYTTYRDNLIRFVNETKAKGAIPILCTSIVRRKFDENGILTDTHGNYPVVTRQVAQELNVALLDMEAKTRELVTQLGPEKSKELFLYTDSGVYPNRPKGVKDDTHLNFYGAKKIAGLAVNEMKLLKLPLTNYLKTKVEETK